MALALLIGIAGTDYTAVIKHDSLIVRLNTMDVDLIDPTGSGGLPSVAVGQPVTIAVMSWTGTVASTETRDADDIRGNSIVIWHISATNTSAGIPVGGAASYGLSDQPTIVTDTILLEDGSGGISLEDGTVNAPGLIEMEGALSGYGQLTVLQQSNNVPVGPFGFPGTSTSGTLTTYQGGLWPGIQFTLNSDNQLIASQLFTVTEVMVTWPASGDQPFFRVSFALGTGSGIGGSGTSDQPWTLLKWTQSLIRG